MLAPYARWCTAALACCLLSLTVWQLPQGLRGMILGDEQDGDGSGLQLPPLANSLRWASDRRPEADDPRMSDCDWALAGEAMGCPAPLALHAVGRVSAHAHPRGPAAPYWWDLLPRAPAAAMRARSVA